MDMVIKNGDEAFLNALKAIAKLYPKVEIKQISYEDKILSIHKKTIKDYKDGNIKAYDNIKDLRASLDEI